ncbi:MAG: tyrosine-type recombinase/integrase [Hyphomonadaceae bacterium]
MLTDEIAQAIPAPKRGRREVGDIRVRGLAVRVTPAGARTWSVGYKVAGEGGISCSGRLLKGRQHRVTLGSVLTLPIDSARSQALDILRSAERGIDPRTGRRAANEQRYSNTVSNVASRMVADAKLTVPSWPNMDTVLRLHVLPELGTRPVEDITRADIAAHLDQLKRGKSVAVAREARKYLGRLLNFAADRGVIASNPMTGLKRRDLRYVPVTRVLTDAELIAAWRAAGAMPYPYGPALSLLMLTGQRRREILHTSWADIDRKERLLRIPPERHKQGRGHVVPLSDAAWTVLQAIPQRRGQQHLFIGRTGNVADLPSNIADKFILLVQANLPPEFLDQEEPAAFTIHDLRRTCKTRLAALGVRADVRDAVLGHAPEGMDRTYNHYEYLKECRIALELYARHILELERTACNAEEAASQIKTRLSV